MVYQEPLKAVAALNPPGELAGPATPGRLLDAVTRTLYHYIYTERTAKCPTCITNLKGPGSQFDENRKQPGHTCVFQYGTPTGNGPVTVEEWDKAVTALTKDQIVEAFMLSYNQGSYKEIAEFEYNKYLATHHVAIMDKMNEYFKEFLVFDHNVFNYRNVETTADYKNVYGPD